MCARVTSVTPLLIFHLGMPPMVSLSMHRLATKKTAELPLRCAPMCVQCVYQVTTTLT